MSGETPSGKATSIIGADVEIVGQIKSASPIHIDGTVDGELLVQADVTLGKTGTVKGNLSVNSISISGTVEGNVVAKDKIEMKSTAKVLGDIKAKRLAVEDGVTFIGRSEVNPSGQPVAGAGGGGNAGDTGQPKPPPSQPKG
mgnify:CR=1 FL=1